MNNYEAKLEARRDRLEARADRLDAVAAAAFKRADLREEVSGIPLGQPILVGHHSEARHRKAIDRAHNAMGRGVEAERAAAEARERAAGVGHGGISSDDPEAVAKLGEKLAKLEAGQEFSKKVNAIVRKGRSAKGSVEAGVAAMVAMGISERNAADMFKPDECGRYGIPAYASANRSAEIRRVKQRIEVLKKAAGRSHAEIELPGDVRCVQNVEDNRLQFFFPGKPSAEIRSLMKSNGFRWAPSVEAWQRQLNNRAVSCGKYVIQKLKEIDEK